MALLFAATFISPASAERRVALVIGNADYAKSPDLKNPSNDAVVIADRLNSLGFDLVGNGPHINVSRIGLARLLRDFSKKVGKGDTALLYYAGHGIGAHNTNWLIPVDDVDIRSELDLPDFAISVNSVLDRLDRRGGGSNIVWLDACRDNPLPSTTRSKGAGSGLGRMRAPNGTFIAYAADPGSVAFDGTGKNGVFTTALIQALEIPDRPLYEIMRAVRRNVRDATDGAQTPWTEESLNHEFYFQAPRTELVTAARRTSKTNVGLEPQSGLAKPIQKQTSWNLPNVIDKKPSNSEKTNSSTTGMAFEAEKSHQNSVDKEQIKSNRTKTTQISKLGEGLGNSPSSSDYMRSTIRPKNNDKSIIPADSKSDTNDDKSTKIAAATVVLEPTPLNSDKVIAKTDYGQALEKVRKIIGELALVDTSAATNFTVLTSSGDTRLTATPPPQFAITKTEITRRMWRSCATTGQCKVIPDGNLADTHPITDVSMKDVQNFIGWVNEVAGLQNSKHAIRLPTELEWDFAARGATSSKFPFGSDLKELCNFENTMDLAGAEIDDVFRNEAASCNDGFKTTAPVASYKPNMHGIFDMLGNVSEWVEDCAVRRVKHPPVDGGANRQKNCRRHVIRGGSWMTPIIHSGIRSGGSKPNRLVGFRLAMTR